MVATRERPIIFSAEMVRAILDGRKSQTRRVVKMPTGFKHEGSRVRQHDAGWQFSAGCFSAWSDPILCPYGQPGDLLWVRETWAIDQCGRRASLAPEAWPYGFPINRLKYVATDTAPAEDGKGGAYWWNSRSSIYMPRWASRITLEVESVRVERVQDISEADVLAEGYEKRPEGWTKACWASNLAKSHPQDAFAYSWNQLNTKRGYGWDKNPWVWVVEFKRLGAHT